MYIVEVRHDGDGLAEPMAKIPSWLDHERIQPSVFRLSLVVGATIFRLESKSATDAEAFRAPSDDRSSGTSALGL
jgi:hypothetical protein